MAEITMADISTVKGFGTQVVSGTSRFVVPLDKLSEPVDFINPKDAGTEWGAQRLKGDGNDILLFNGLSSEQIKTLNDEIKEFESSTLKPITDMNKEEVVIFLSSLKEKGFNDMYCSDKAYMESSLTAENPKERIGLYTRNKDEVCYGVVIPKGTVYNLSERGNQEATVDGALLIVPANGDPNNVRITNEPKDYTSVKGGKVSTLAQAKMVQQECIKVEAKQENKESIINTDSTIKSFSEYFAGYKNYDNGGKLDQLIIADAKKVFETLKTPEEIQSFYKADYKTQEKMVAGLDDGHSSFSFRCVCQCAYNYAEYAQNSVKEQSKTNEEQNKTNRLASARKRLAGKNDEKLGTNLSDIKLPKTIKNIEAKISKHFDKSGR